MERSQRIARINVLMRQANGVTMAQLMDDLLARVHRGSNVYLDVPEPNTAGRVLAEGLGLIPVFETARMYRGGDPGLPLSKVFGVTTFELG